MSGKLQRLEVDVMPTQDGLRVTIEIDNLGMYEGSRIKLERKFSGRRDTVRYRAAKHILATRKAWRDGALMEIMEP